MVLISSRDILCVCWVLGMFVLLIRICIGVLSSFFICLGAVFIALVLVRKKVCDYFSN